MLQFKQWRALLFLWCISSSIYPSKDSSDKSPKTTKIKVSAQKLGNGVSGTYQQISFQNSENQVASQISEVIEKQHGVTVNRYGPPGTFSTLSIRGAAPNQTSIYFNGMLLNNALGGAVNLETLPLDILSSAELYRSFTPPHLPAANVGGALDLIPLQPSGKKTILFTNIKAQTLVGGAFGLGIITQNSLHYAKVSGSRNRFTFVDDKNTIFTNTDDDELKTRTNDDVISSGYTGTWRSNFGKLQLKALVDYLWRERGIAGTVSLPLNEVRLETHRALTKIEATLPIKKFFSLRAYTDGNFDYSLFLDPAQELPTGLIEQRRYSLRSEIGIEPIFYLWSDKVIIRSLINEAFTDVNVDSEKLATRNEVDFSSNIELRIFPNYFSFSASGKSQFIEDKPKPALDNIEFGVTLIEDSEDWLNSANLKLDFFLQHLLDLTQVKKGKEQILTIFAEFSYAERFPSLTEKFGDGSALLPAPELTKEQSQTWSTGIQAKPNCKAIQCAFHLSAFQTNFTDLIIFFQNSQQTTKAINIGKARIRGIEVEVKWNYKSVIVNHIRHTFISAIDKGEFPFYFNKALPLIPRYETNSYIESGFSQIRFFADLIWQGSTYRDRFNQERNFVPSRFILNSGVTWHINIQKTQTLNLIAKNVLNNKISDIVGYPLPGRYFEAQIKFKI